MIEPQSLLDQLRKCAEDEGFSLLGVAPAIDASGFSDLTRWIESGYAGGMDYFANRLGAYQHPRGVLDGTRSIIALAQTYPAADFSERDRGDGKIARYVWNRTDYHDVIHPKLKRLCGVIQEAHPSAIARGVVDTAPLLEREIAQLAGLGWRGKNTLLLNKQLGSYFFLACLLTDIELPYNQPHEHSHCGTCTACLDACPTDAFPRPGVLDATRCISYLTIEHRGPIPEELREGIGDWLFGCDVCQEVCPWNRKPARHANRPETPLDHLDARELFRLSDEQFRERFRKTALWRTKRRGILRNAAIVLGNERDETAVPELIHGLADAEPIVRGACAWALKRISGEAARQAVSARLEVEPDEYVRGELRSD